MEESKTLYPVEYSSISSNLSKDSKFSRPKFKNYYMSSPQNLQRKLNNEIAYQQDDFATNFLQKQEAPAPKSFFRNYKQNLYDSLMNYYYNN